MQVRREANGLLVVNLTRGENIRAKVEEMAFKESIVGAEVSAIGAVANPELGYYKLDERDYIRRFFPGDWELLSLLGNITQKDGKPFLHAHASLSGKDFNVIGGHLFDARVAVVVEMLITRIGTPLRRVYCDDVGLHCWELTA